MGILRKMMRRDAETPEAQKVLDGVKYREVSIRQDQIRDEDQRVVDIAFSSDTPILRNFFGYKFQEVLSHDEGSVRMDRMNDGGALLMDHNPRDQIGVVESAQIEGGKARATVRFSRSERAQEIFRDVQDGIRTKISVGYRIHGHEEIEGKDGEVDTIRISDWEPLEVSFVSIPADASVGVGREDIFQPEQENEMFNKDRKPEQDAEARDEVTEGGGDEGGHNGQAAADPANDQPKREAVNDELRQIGEKFGEKQLAEEIIELDGSAEDLKREIRNKRANVSPMNHRDSQVEHRDSPRVEVREKHIGPLRGFRDEESAYRAGMWTRGVILGDSRAQRWCKDHGMRVMTESVFTKGGATVPTEMEAAIIDLRERYGVARRILRVVPMSTDTKRVPRRTGGVTAYAIGETDSITESDKSWDDVELVARKWGALSRFSTDYAEDSVIDVAQDLANEMAYAFAKKEDEAMIDGDGTSTYHGIVGFRTKLVDGSHTAGALDATSGDNTLPEIVSSDLGSLRGILPDYAEANAKWLCHKTAKVVVFDEIMRAAGGTTMQMLGDQPRDAYLGDEIITSNAMPGNTSTDYENTAMLLYGDFMQAATMGDRRGFTFQVLNERYAEYDQIGVKGTTRWDIVVHDLGDTSDAGPVVGLIGN